jgi:hypothetical protein
MVQILMALAIVAALVYFVLFRTGTDPETGQSQPYAEEVQKAEDVQQLMQAYPQQQQRQLDVQLEPRQVDDQTE